MNQLFKINNTENSIPIVLKKIEELYSLGVFNSDDTIFVANDQFSPFTPFKIGTLIKLYGAEYPFRRNLRPRSEETMENDFFSSSDDNSEDSPQTVTKQVRKKSVVVDVTKNQYFMFSPDSTTESNFTDNSSELQEEYYTLEDSASPTLNTPILEFNNPRVPLLDLNEQNVYSVDERRTRLDELVSLWSRVEPYTWSVTGVKIWEFNRKSTCFACKLKENSFPSCTQLAAHIFSNKHKKLLLKIGFTPDDYFIWKNCLNRALSLKIQTPKKTELAEETQEIQEQTAPRRIAIVQPQPQKPQVFHGSLQFEPNYPKIPLLDLPVPSFDGTLDLYPHAFFKYRVLQEKWKVADKQMMFKTELDKTVYCNVCHWNDEVRIGMSTLFELGEHLFSEDRHPRKLKNRATLENFKYWDEIFAKIELNSTNGDEERNVPRIPLLDRPSIGLEYEIDEYWNEMRQERENLKRKYDIRLNKSEKKIRCYICYKDGFHLSSDNLLIGHILSFTHRNNLKKIGVSRKDVDYWLEILQKEDLKKEKWMKWPLGLLYSNFDHILIPALQKTVLTYEKIAQKFKELREKVKGVDRFSYNVRFRNLFDQYDEKTCYWCKFEFEDSFQVLEHVVSKEHEEQAFMKCQITNEDFDEWFDRIKILEEIEAEEKLQENEKNYAKANCSSFVRL